MWSRILLPGEDHANLASAISAIRELKVKFCQTDSTIKNEHFIVLVGRINKELEEFFD